MKLKNVVLLVFCCLPVQMLWAQNQSAEFVQTVAQDIAVANLNESAEYAKTLAVQAQTFCQQKDEAQLAQLQRQWAQSMQAWSKVKLFTFGPVTADNIDLKIHYLPLRKKQIEQAIVDRPSDAELLPVSARGLAAIEYLIFDRKSSDLELIETFEQSEGRCDFLRAISNQLKKDIDKVQHDWQGSFVEQFAEDQAKITTNEALGITFRSLISYLEATIKNRVGRAGGINTGKPLPYKSESWRSGTSIQNLQAGLQAFKELLEIEQGLGDLLVANDQAALRTRLLESVDSQFHALALLQPDLFTAVNESADAVLTVYQNYQQLIRLVKQAAQSLNIQMGFNDQDGD